MDLMHIPTCHTWNLPCELAVCHRFVPLNISAIFLAPAEILFLAVTGAALPFVLTKVGPCVFFFSFALYFPVSGE